MNLIEQAKARITIHDIWQRMNLAGKPSKCCRNPFREDKRPSFSVTDDGRLFNDFATGAAGDAIAFLQLATDTDRKTACRQFIQMAGLSTGTGQTYTLKPRPRLPEPAQPPREKPALPATERGTAPMLNALAKLRNLSTDGIRLADERGLLRFATLKGFTSWIITDSSGLNAQARRLDGGTWAHLPDSPKAYTMPGSWAQWPIGIEAAADFPVIALVEGGPDLLAACHFIYAEGRDADVAPVAMLGAMQRIHEEALPLFTSKTVRIFPHLDQAGHEAARRWTAQLEAKRARVDCFDLSCLTMTDGQPVQDLNDLTSISPDQFESERDIWSLFP